MFNSGHPARWLAGVICGVCVILPVHSEVIISEILYDIPSRDNGNVFVELYGPPGMSLSGLSLQGINGRNGGTYMEAALDGVFPGSGLFLIGDDWGDGTTAIPGANLVAEVDFQNGPDSVILTDGTDVLDALGYGDFSTNIFAGEGDPAAAVEPGQSLFRPVPWNDTDNNAADFVAGAPTPGVAAALSVPLSGAMLYLLSGISAMLVTTRSRRRGRLEVS